MGQTLHCNKQPRYLVGLSACLANLAVPCSIPGGENLFNRNKGFITYSLLSSPYYRLYMVEILFEGRNIASHLFM